MRIRIQYDKNRPNPNEFPDPGTWSEWSPCDEDLAVWYRAQWLLKSGSPKFLLDIQHSETKFSFKCYVYRSSLYSDVHDSYTDQVLQVLDQVLPGVQRMEVPDNAGIR